MASIIIPRKKQPQDYLSLAGGLAGGVAGAYVGGPFGAAQGYGMGSSAGGMAGGLYDASTRRQEKDATMQNLGVRYSEQSGPMDQVQGGLGVAAGVTNTVSGAKDTFGGGSGENSGGQGAMSRRMQQMENDPVMQLRKSKNALQHASPDIRQQYEPVIDNAYEQALAQQRKQRGHTYG